LTFGVLAEAVGMGAVAAVVMSATTFAGSAQFASASVLDTGGTVTAAIVSALLLNARYIGLSITVSSIVPGGRLRRFASSQLIVDESWALSGRGGRFQWPILAGAGMLLYVLWVSSTALGTVVGGVVDDPNAVGLDAAFAALFLALAQPYLRGRRTLTAVAFGIAITLVLIPFAPAGLPLVAAAAACLIGLRR
jgi:4-azaleucine resistance transporter AzlC